MHAALQLLPPWSPPAAAYCPRPLSLYRTLPPQGAGDRAFCAGGDVKTVVQLGQAGRIEEALRWENITLLLGCRID